MLFTRCPDCDTTFRVTDDALKKANGQVRCGRCASVFNAYAEMRDGPSEPAGSEPASETSAAAAVPSAAEQAAAPTAAATTPAAAKSVPLPSVKIAHALHPSRRETTRHEFPIDENAAPAAAIDDVLGSMSVADVVAQVERGVADENAETPETTAQLEPPSDADGISPSQVQRVLESEEPSIGTWHLVDAPESHRRIRPWTAAAALALLTLVVQGVHHYRAQLVANAAVGPLVQRTYAMLGATVVPRWDIRQYEILDWIATAEPNARGKGSLRITARIKNRGPLYQPYPSVHLRLKDRWEEAVGSRVFAPAEYLAAAPRKLMAPGETTRAELEIVDPGQDAYGFELDVCIEVETHVLSCGSDKVFL
jgi:predicted Zn finger-like uncharacterized protein